jgi:TolA-binding protein
VGAGLLVMRPTDPASSAEAASTAPDPAPDLEPVSPAAADPDTPAFTAAQAPIASARRPASSPPERPGGNAARRNPDSPPLSPRPAASDAEAAQHLDVARAKLANNLVDQGVEDLRQIVGRYPGTPFAIEASFLMADSLARAGRADDAMAAYVEFEQRYGGDARVAESKLRRATLLSQSRAAQRQTEAYDLYGEIARNHPATAEAKRALQARRQVETERRQLRAVDPVLNAEVPALLVTLRTLADQFPSDPESMLALNQLAGAYADMDRFQAAADVWERLAAQFPGNPMEVWFRLGELYERRLRNPVKAREAYAKVPPESPRHREAQQRLTRK